MVLKIAHRGASAYAQENSMQAFEKALEMNVDGVEFDVHLTKDKQIIVMHDDNVQRTTNGFGLIKDLTLEQIRMFHQKQNSEPVPTLQEVLSLLDNKCICKIDVKTEGIEERLINIIKKYKIEDSVIVTSKSLNIIKKIKELDPKITTEMQVWKPWNAEEMIQHAKEVKADIIAPNYLMCTKELVEKAHKDNLKVHVWTVNKIEEIEKMKIIGVDGIVSDIPDKI
ncbi:hypothetical protein DRJ25_00970 [Candidatus Woesearchaeota archaeon]|nr:MAG: hypothetical protein DRJ25_00970 [Candidatus Woesearchaeota archaeon]